MARDDDDGERLLCRKNAGKRGQAYEEWEREYLDACGAKGDEDASWEDTFLGNDTRAGLSAAATAVTHTHHAHRYLYCPPSRASSVFTAETGR